MNYTVRERGKTGGSKYETLFAAYRAALSWFSATGIACDVIDPYGAILYSVEATQ